MAGLFPIDFPDARMNSKMQVERCWYVVDAEGKVPGRLAAKVARVLQGKHKPSYLPHVDTGDFVIVVNAAKIRVTGKKAGSKIYRRHSGYIGGLKEVSLEKMLERKPTEVIRHAVRGMMPKTVLGKKMFSKLRVYAGAAHPHQAQKPEPIEV